LPEIVIPSASTLTALLSRVSSVPIGPWGLRVSGAVAPSAPAKPDSPNRFERNYRAEDVNGKWKCRVPAVFCRRRSKLPSHKQAFAISMRKSYPCLANSFAEKT
jgi:hypothetical protein